LIFAVDMQCAPVSTLQLPLVVEGQRRVPCSAQWGLLLDCHASCMSAWNCVNMCIMVGSKRHSLNMVHRQASVLLLLLLLLQSLLPRMPPLPQPPSQAPRQHVPQHSSAAQQQVSALALNSSASADGVRQNSGSARTGPGCWRLWSGNLRVEARRRGRGEASEATTALSR
jgi:hypothetical protein